MPSDTELLDWLKMQDGGALISDDFGNWAFVSDGIQNIPFDDDGEYDLSTTYWVEKHAFRNSIREALAYAMEREK